MDIDSGDIKSPTGYGYVLTLGGGTISWKSAKQNFVSWYTMAPKILVVNNSVAQDNIYYLYDFYHY